MDPTLHGMDQENFELGLFQEMKVMYGIYTRESSGYRVLVANTPIQHQVVVTVLFHLLTCSQVEAHQFHDSNVSSFYLDWGGGSLWGVTSSLTMP